MLAMKAKNIDDRFSFLDFLRERDFVLLRRDFYM